MTAVETAQSATPELLDLERHEAIIEKGLQSFVDVGNALMAIKANKKYRAAGYATFEDYLQQRWDMSRAYGHRLVTAASIVDTLSRELAETEMSPVGNILPTAEAQVRPLSALEPEQQIAVWTAAVEAAGGQPTATQVQAAVEEITAPTNEERLDQLGVDYTIVDEDTLEVDLGDVARAVAAEADEVITPDAVMPPPALTAEEQRELDLIQSDRRTARYVQAVISNWPAVRDLRDNPRRAQILACLPASDLEYLTPIEEAIK